MSDRDHSAFGRHAAPRIRAATAADVPAIDALVRVAYARYLPRMGHEPAPVRADHLAEVRAGSTRVAEADGRLLGVVVLTVTADHVLVDSVAVLPAAWGTGLGARLLALADDLAREHGLTEVRLYTHETMTENQAYYPRHGFVETCRGGADHRVHYRKVL